MATPKKKTAKKSIKTPVKKQVKKTASPKKTTAAQKPVSRSASLTPVQNTTLDTLYVINGSGNNITLAIKVGDKGQTSNMTIKVNDAVIVQNHPGDFATTSLGTGDLLDGKKLSIVATIADTSRETNVTSLKIQLQGGLDPADFLLSKEVDQEGASADYLCLIEFFKP